MRRALLLIALIAAILATSVGWYGARQYESLVLTQPFVVAQVAIAPYTVVTAEMLTTVDLPAVLAQDQPVYVRPAEVIGKITTTEILTGTLIYRHQAAAAADFRYTDDPRAEIIALGLPLEQAVAGQVRPGQRVNVYRLAWGESGGAAERRSEGAEERGSGGANVTAPQLPGSPAPRLSTSAVELVVAQALVRGVYATPGAITHPAPVGAAVSTETEPVTILVLEVTPADAHRLVQLLADRRGACDLWVSLAPLTPATATPTLVPARPEPTLEPGSPGPTPQPGSPTPPTRRSGANFTVTPCPTAATPAGPAGGALGPISIGGGR